MIRNKTFKSIRNLRFKTNGKTVECHTEKVEKKENFEKKNLLRQRQTFKAKEDFKYQKFPQIKPF